MKGRLLLDVIVGKGAAVLELLSGKDKALLVGRDAFLVLDLGLHRAVSCAPMNDAADSLP